MDKQYRWINQVKPYFFLAYPMDGQYYIGAEKFLILASVKSVSNHDAYICSSWPAERVVGAWYGNNISD